MIIKYKRSEYKIDVDRHQYTLMKKSKGGYIVEGYYSNPFPLLMTMVKIGLINHDQRKDIGQNINAVLDSLSLAIEKALPKPLNDGEEE